MNDSRLQLNDLGYLEVRIKPSKESLAAYYEKNYYQNESAGYRKEYSKLELEVIRLRIAQRSAKALGLLKENISGRMLDVGCGEGFAISYYKELGWSVTGIDFSSAGVKNMHPELLSFVRQGDVFKLLENQINANEKYDLIWLGNVLEHVLDPTGLLISLRKIISQNGILVLTVPNDGNAFHEELYRDGLINERFWIAIPDHLSYFTQKSIKQIATFTGYDCLDLQGDFPIDFYLAHEGSNYVTDRLRGSGAHQARLRLERLIGEAGLDAANRFYSSLGAVGLGRNHIAYLRPQAPKNK
jgi:2-polyprenyl-3-methyl-5-hydroxy-6-metoxy-1,4-benzoquinol methylase